MAVHTSKKSVEAIHFKCFDKKYRQCIQNLQKLGILVKLKTLSIIQPPLFPSCNVFKQENYQVYQCALWGGLY